jgi:hypothetical protein
MSNKKKEFGQFFTKNTQHILGGSVISILPVEGNFTIVDPFAGEGDLLKFIKRKRKYLTIEAYDIDPKTPDSIQRDSLLEPIDLGGKWIITNPPYLAKNKTEEKTPFLKYEVDDLYKASLKMIGGFAGNTPCEGGIIIIPVNFFSDRDDSIRKFFLSKYKVHVLNIFEEQVFEDTSYTVCSFSFLRRDDIANQRIKTAHFFPSGDTKEFRISKGRGFRIGFEFFQKIEKKRKKNWISVSRLVEGKSVPNGHHITNIHLRAIDTGTKDGRICLFLDEKSFYGKESDRTFANFVTSVVLSTEQQETVVRTFNIYLEYFRCKYHSMFLTNFRNSTIAYSRKRIEFKTAFDIIETILNTDKIKVEDYEKSLDHI